MKRILLHLLAILFSTGVFGQEKHASVLTNGRELLYNGIVLDEHWPPRNIDRSREPIEIPYLQNPPQVIPVNTGRQLFIDDFLIEESSLTRVFHAAKKSPLNPIFKPETEVEMNGGNIPVAAPFNDGIWYDSKDKVFKMWYHAGWFSGTAYAVSIDGFKWARPVLNVVSGTNLIIKPRKNYLRDGASVWLDKETLDSASRFKMFLFNRHKGGEGGEIYKSGDGIHWNLIGNTSALGDNSSFFYNPFRKKWVFSIRNYWEGKRVRYYREADDFVQASQWSNDTASLNSPVFWQKADALDLPDKIIRDTTQFYDADVVPYESIMLGLFTIHRGPSNQIAEFGGFPKITELNLGYSRDGFHFFRPDRTPFIAGTHKIGDWDRDYIHAVGGGCTINDDSLYFYYSAWSGVSPQLISNMYAGGAMGVASIRRDGFASLEATSAGTMTTKLLTFTGEFLFVNADASQGQLKVEVLDENSRPVRFLTKEDCEVVSVNSTIHNIKWKKTSSLSKLKGKKVRFKFYLENASLYAFWVTPDHLGASFGYVAAGGPGYSGDTDKEGMRVLIVDNTLK